MSSASFSKSLISFLSLFFLSLLSVSSQGCNKAKCSDGTVPVAGICVPSVRSDECGECPALSPYCDTQDDRNQCVACLVDDDCTAEAPACNEARQCVACDQDQGTGGGCVATLQDLSVRVNGVDQIGEFFPMQGVYQVQMPLWTNEAEFSAQASSAELVRAQWPAAPGFVPWLGNAQLATALQLNDLALIHVQDAGTPQTREPQQYNVELIRGTRTALSHTDVGRIFGSQVALEGDRLAVAARNNGVYIYERVGTNWELRQSIQPNAALVDRRDDFAWSIALSGSHLAVGAPSYSCGPNENDCASDDRGAVLLYHFNGTQWVFSGQLLLASNNYQGERFGFSVAIDGNRMAVGARTEKSPGMSCQSNATKFANDVRVTSGAVYIFSLNPNTSVATETACLKAMGPATAAPMFGASVDIEGNRLVVGAPGAYNGRIDGGGLAFISTFNGSAWLPFFELNVADSPDSRVSQFGHAVAISGNDVAVSAPNQYNAPGNAWQHIYMFDYTNAQRRPYQALDMSSNLYTNFGRELELSGDKLVTSAAAWTTGRYGAFVMFKKQGAVWSRNGYGTPPDQISDSVNPVGVSVAVNNDRIVTGVVASGSGTVHIYQ